MYPRVLYKYRSWDVEWHRNALRNRTVYFASPNQFNDPFDCRIYADYDSMSDHQLMNIALSDPELVDRLISITRKYGHNVSRAQVLEYLRSPDWFSTFRSSLQNGGDTVFAEARGTFLGIFSLTSVRDSILMWSHYSDQHRGFFIGYSVPHLMAAFEAISNVGNSIPLLKVQYARKYPHIVASDPEKDPKWVSEQFTTKFDGWEYEQE